MDSIKRRFDVKQVLLKYIFEILVVALVIALSLTTNGFFSFKNIIGIFRSISLYGVLAFGITVVIISGEIDLSTPPTIAMTGVIMALLCKNLPIPPLLALIIGVMLMVIVAFVVGTINSFLVLKFKCPSFIATMAMMYVMFGITATICGGFPVVGFPDWFNTLGSGMLFGLIPVPAIILVMMFFITQFIMINTKMGRSIYAVGGNQEAARLSGLNVNRIKRFSFIYVQLCAVISGIMVSSQVMSGTFTFGDGWDFQGISCAIIGGTSFTGGKGRIWGTFIGLFFYGMVNNAMTLLNVSQFIQYIVRGLIIMFAVIVNSYRRD